jgi:hypothetical protein
MWSGVVAVAQEGIEHIVGLDLRAFMRHIPDPHIAFRIGPVAAHAVVPETTSRNPEVLERPDFVDEVVALLHRYLRRPNQ